MDCKKELAWVKREKEVIEADNRCLRADRLVSCMTAQLLVMLSQEREHILRKELEEEREARKQQKAKLEEKISSLLAEIATKDEQLTHYQKMLEGKGADLILLEP